MSVRSRVQRSCTVASCCQWPSALAADRVCCMVGLWRFLTQWAPLASSQRIWEEIPDPTYWNELGVCEANPAVTWLTLLLRTRDWDDSSPGAGPPVVPVSFPASPQRVHPRKSSTCFDLHPQNGNTHPGAGRWAWAALPAVLPRLPAVLPAASGTPGQLFWCGQTSRNLFLLAHRRVLLVSFSCRWDGNDTEIAVSHHIAVFLLPIQHEIKGLQCRGLWLLMEI